MIAPLTYKLPVIVQTLKNRLMLAEGLGVPAILWIGDDESTLVRRLVGNISRFLEGDVRPSPLPVRPRRDAGPLP